MHVELRSQALAPWDELARYEAAQLAGGTYGATATFVGTMRDFHADRSVERMFLEHYPGMTERQLERIVAAESARAGIVDALVVHRVGWLEPADAIVLVAVWAAHRGPAFDACRAIMEALKSRAPFWKHEATDQGGRWVTANTPDH